MGKAGRDKVFTPDSVLMEVDEISKIEPKNSRCPKDKEPFMQQSFDGFYLTITHFIGIIATKFSIIVKRKTTVSIFLFNLYRF